MRITQGTFACLPDLGALELEAGHPEEARSLLEQGRDLSRGFDPRFEVLAIAYLCGLEATGDRIPEARRLLDTAERLVTTMDVPSLSAVLGVQRGLLELALAREARAAGDGSSEARWRAAAASRTTPVPLQHHAFEVRFSLRLLRRELGMAGASEARELVVHQDGHWVELPGGSRVLFRKRQAMRRILVELVRQRTTSPGRAVSAPELLAVGWPGERILPEAARNRLHAALSTMRRLGLDPVLLTTGDGYLLDPEVPLRVARS